MKRLKISLKQAIGYVDSPDPDYDLKRRTIAYAFSVALHHPDKNVHLFQDELIYYSQPDNTPKYGATGKRPPRVSRASIDNVMTRIEAVMNGLTGQVSFIQINKFGKLAMAQLYRQVRQVYPQRKILVIQDNVSFHYSDNVLATAAKLDIIPVFLPTCASHLNPIEKLWRWLKATSCMVMNLLMTIASCARLLPSSLTNLAMGRLLCFGMWDYYPFNFLKYKR